MQRVIPSAFLNDQYQLVLQDHRSVPKYSQVLQFYPLDVFPSEAFIAVQGYSLVLSSNPSSFVH